MILNNATSIIVADQHPSGDVLTIKENVGFDNSDYENIVFADNIPEVVTDSRKRGKQVKYLPSKPTTGAYDVGDIVYKTTPVGSQPIGWVCVEGGSPGIWKGFGVLEA